MIKAIDTDALTGIDKAESYLKSTLALLDEGEKLPSMRDIKNSCGVGQSAIERVIARMVADGQVVAKPRSGYYKGLDQGRRTEILIFEELPNAHSLIYYRNFFNHMAKELVSNKRQVRLNEMFEEPSSCWFDGLQNGPEQTLITFRLKMDRVHIINRVKECGVPCLHVLPNFAEYIGPTVTIDDEQLVRTQLEYLIKLGHRKVGYLHWVEDRKQSRARTQRLDAFCSMAIQMGLEIKPHYVCNIGNHGETAGEAVKAWCESGDKPSAVIIYDEHVKQVYEALYLNNTIPGKDIAVLGTNDCPWTSFTSPSLSSARVCLDSLGRELIDSLKALECGIDPGYKSLDIKIIERDSTFGLD